MNSESAKLPVGTQVLLAKQDLQELIDQLLARGYQVVGPQVADGAIVLDSLHSIAQLPEGWLDEQDGGHYRLKPAEQAGYFDHVVGPHSLKPYLFPPSETLQQLERTESGWVIQEGEPAAKPVAILGARSCDLHALAIQDRVFLEGPYVDAGYQARRESLFLISVQCRRAAATCFCHSMKAGPRASSGFDLALSELDSYFVVEVGTVAGGAVLSAVEGWALASTDQVDEAQHQSARLLQSMNRRTGQTATDEGPQLRQLDAHDVRELLLENLEHPLWQQVGERCLSCANCTLVCPTCFCSSVNDVSDLSGDQVRRERHWTSCFNADHSYVTSGVVHRSTASRYRQWLTHKLATWHDQFGTSGCVGCGRCITWCPVGIDLTQEIAALREATS